MSGPIPHLLASNGAHAAPGGQPACEGLTRVTRLVLAAGESESCRELRNRRAADADWHGILLTVLLHGSLIVARLKSGDLSPGVALLCGVIVLHMLAHALLIKRRPGWHAAWRELGALAMDLHLAVNVRLLTTHIRRPDYASYYEGSSLRILALLLVPSSPAFWTGIAVLYRRLPLRWSALVLASAAAVPVLFGRSACHLFATDLPAQAPIYNLYLLFGTACTAPLFPYTLPLGEDAGDSLKQCLVVDSWLHIVLGVALPLLLLRHLERRARGGPRSHVQAFAAAPQAAPSLLAFPPDCMGGAWAEGYVYACGAWLAATLVVGASEPLWRAVASW